ncbi:MAG: ATP phosphoribosyltransferase regulatory subunit [Pseudomonadota bacterium]
MPDALIRRLTTLFKNEGFQLIDPPILQPVAPFMALSGEDVRQRMYLTRDPEGREFCLRPDFTIPTARQHVAAPDGGRYAYLGPVFRHRSGQDEPGEFVQGGIEWFGEADTAKADATILKLALDITATAHVHRATVRVGDIGLQSAFLDSLGLADVWRRRLWQHQGRGGDLAAVFATNGTDTASFPALATLMTSGDAETAASVIEDVLKLAGTETVGGRGPQEIAQRFVEKALASSGVSDEQQAAITSFMAINAPLSEAMSLLETQFPTLDLTLAKRRMDEIAAMGLDLSTVQFDAGFTRPLDYHNGFVFEVVAPRSGEKLIGGGRYDALTERLGASAEPAVGLSLWLDRLIAAGGAT